MSEKSSKNLKKFGLYLGIAFLVVLGLLLACVVYLFIFPEGDIFGVVYAQDKQMRLYSSSMYSAESVLGIKLDVKKYNVSVEITDQYDDIRVYVYTNSAGYVKETKTKAGFEMLLNPETGILEMSTIELSGFIIRNESKIRLFIPKGYLDLGNFNVSVSAKSDSNITIAGDEKFESKIGLLELSVNRGDVFIDDVSIDRAKIVAKRSSITAGENLVGEIREMVLDIGNSSVNLLSAGHGQEEYGKEKPNYDNVDFNIQTLKLASARKKAKIYILKCDTVTSVAGQELKAGKIRIYRLKNQMQILTSKNFNVEIGEIVHAQDVLESTFVSTGKGKVAIYNTNAVCILTTNKGGIVVGNAYNSLVLESGSGDINASRVRESVQVVTDSGDVSIKFEDDLGDCVESSPSVSGNNIRKIDVLRVGSSTVNIEGVDNIQNLEAGENAKLSIKYHKVVGNNVFDMTKSNAKIIVPAGGDINLKIESDGANVSVAVGTYKREKSKLALGTIIDETVYANTSSNIIDIKSKGGDVELYSSDLI